MEDYRLTLKNIYRFLTINDYPVFSDGIFSREKKKGMTLVRFWTTILPERWRNTVHGAAIWRLQEGKNRYLSHLCNRKGEIPFYADYVAEVLRGLTTTELAEQIRTIDRFLTDHECNRTVFREKLGSFLTCMEEGDPIYSANAAAFFRHALAWYHSPACKPDEVDAWFLTFLSLHALAGERMDDKLLTGYREGKAYTPPRLLNVTAKQNDSVILLTSGVREMRRQALPSEQFFGREKELFDLEDAVRAKQKLLISGIGGVGKTELLRQLTGRLLRSRRPVRIALVHYEYSLPFSFSRAFLNLRGVTEEERFHEALSYLADPFEGDTVLMIDNLDKRDDEDAVYAQLVALDCTVLITSRMKRVEGFSNYVLQEPDLNAASLIFRSHYGRVLSAASKEKLDTLLREYDLRHPLTARLLAHSASAGTLHLDDFLAEYLLENQANLEAGLIKKLPERAFHDVYKRLYRTTGLDEEEKEILELFAMWPYKPVREADIMYFHDAERKADRFRSKLQHLAELGWLEKTEDSYAMHPVIAESLRRKQPGENQFRGFWEKGEEKLHLRYDRIEWIDKEAEEVALMLLGAMYLLSAPVSERIALLAAKCGYVCLENGHVWAAVENQVDTILHKCINLPDEAAALRMIYRDKSPEVSAEAALIERLERENTIDRDLLSALKIKSILHAVLSGQDDAAEQIERSLESSTLPAPLQAEMMKIKAILLTKKYQMEEAVGIFKQLVDTNGSDSDNLFLTAECSVRAGQILVILGNVKEAKEYLEKGMNAARMFGGPLETLRLVVLSDIASYEGDAQKAVDCLVEALDQTRRMYGEEGDSYLTICDKLGVAYNHMGETKRHEALAWHLRAKELYEKQYPGNPGYQICLNNIGVSYLALDEPEKAREPLEKAILLAEGMAPIAKAEPTWNLSRVWRAFGDTGKEKELLEQAYPIFLQTYGQEHTKTKQAKERLTELDREPNG